MKKNLKAQEEVVKALWLFAKKQQEEQFDCISTFEDGTEVKVNLDAIDNAMRSIMNSFGCYVIGIE